MNTAEFIAMHLARPMTHVVVTRFADGATRRHEVRSIGAAENYAVGEKRKIGRDLLNRETGALVRVVAVDIESL